MLASVEHRGRDDSGTWVSEPIDGSGRRACLGHRRLAIIDTSPAGHEPMFSHDGRYVLTFNGEIYNYRELREQLRSLGHEFRTDCDAEVLLEAISEWGWEAVSRLNGMFAFAVWDNKERTLTLVRDHVGIKPLYYAFIPAQNDSPAAFCLRLGNQSDPRERIDQSRAQSGSTAPVFDVPLVARSKHPLCKHQHCSARSLLQFHHNEIKLAQWWDVSFTTIEEGKNEAFWRERVLDTLDRVVKMEMVADVPLGSFLSGGIDSSGIVALM